MIGTLTNVGTIILGSLIGGFFKKIMSEKVNKTLFSAMGMAAFGLGMNSVVKNMPNSEYPVLFIVSLALGGAIGTILNIDGGIARLSAKAGDGGKLGQGIVTGCLVFCIGTLSILGPVNAALYGDHTFLFTNATLDFVTSMVLASTYGIGMALAAVILLIWQGSIYLLTLMVGSFISTTMMTELSVVGGFLIAMSGLSILEIKDFKTVNFLPSLIFPVVFCLIFG